MWKKDKNELEELPIPESFGTAMPDLKIDKPSLTATNIIAKVLVKRLREQVDGQPFVDEVHTRVGNSSFTKLQSGYELSITASLTTQEIRALLDAAEE